MREFCYILDDSGIYFGNWREIFLCTNFENLKFHKFGMKKF